MKWIYWEDGTNRVKKQVTSFRGMTSSDGRYSIYSRDLPLRRTRRTKSEVLASIPLPPFAKKAREWSAWARVPTIMLLKSGFETPEEAQIFCENYGVNQ